MTQSAPLALALTIAASVALGAEPAANMRRADDVKKIVGLTRKYVADLQARLAYGVFDESYTQTFDATLHSGHREMTGELFLTHLAAEDTWISVHDVATVDGEPVPDHQELVTLLQQGSLQAIGRDVAEYNSRFNIGHIARNFNEPTLALLVLAPTRADDFKFSIERVADVDNIKIVTLRFEEKSGLSRTLVENKQGDRLRAIGEFDVEPDTGRIHRTHFTLAPPDMSVELTTDYAHSAASDLWLPSVFRERYVGKPNGEHEVVTCEARYSNFRTFQVLGKIK